MSWDGSQEDAKRACINHWIRMTPERRQLVKKQYERLISINNGTFEPGHYPLTARRGLEGKPRPYPDKLPWMQAAYEQGLMWLNELIETIDANDLRNQRSGDNA